MRFFAASECVQWCVHHAIELKDGQPSRGNHEYQEIRIKCPGEYTKILPWTDRIVSALGGFDQCLLWVGESGIWPSSENLHLYYRLKEAYKDYHTVDERPGHVFLKHEGTDLVTFLFLVLLFGWDAHVITDSQSLSVFISHDEWVELRHRNQAELEAARAILKL